MKILSLFDGIGCARLALERAGIHISKYYSSEVKPSALKVLDYHYNDIEHLGDINNYNEWEIENIDIIVGGSPCQDLSIANKKRKGLNGDRSSLFYRFVDCLKKFKPKYFLLENNSSMPSKDKQEISKVLGVEPIEINSSLVSAQIRKRLYWTNIPNITQPKDKNILLKDIIDENRKWFDILPCFTRKWQNTDRIKLIGKITRDKSYTLTTKKCHTTNYYLSEDETKMTNLDIHEWEKLQTLPVGYTDCGINYGERFDLVGNAWTVDVIAHIFSFLKEEQDGDIR